MSEYEQTIDFLYRQLPAFERQGAGGYKPGLQTSHALDAWLGQPHRAYRCIHVAGTNGKGSTAHLLAAMLQLMGHRVGLFTSPHLVDFRERIRVNGQMIPREAVTGFMRRYRAAHLQCKPTFFELTSAMAMDHFRQQGCDWAVIEVGLGGRLDSTNIITPALSVITNISMDHTQFLGNTLEQIAGEKAGIIKPGVPVVVGEAPQSGVRKVFQSRAGELHAPITFAQDHPLVTGWQPQGTHLLLNLADGATLTSELGGDYQVANANTVLTAVQALRGLGVEISNEAVSGAFAHVCELTGLMGRWQQLQQHPRVVCDSGHNTGAFTQIVKQLRSEPHQRLHMVLGFMADKNIDGILSLLPREATYYFTQAPTPRALPAATLKQKAAAHHLAGNSYNSVHEACQAALQAAGRNDLIYIGGSMYVLSQLGNWLLRGQ